MILFDAGNPACYSSRYTFNSSTNLYTIVPGSYSDGLSTPLLNNAILRYYRYPHNSYGNAHPQVDILQKQHPAFRSIHLYEVRNHCSKNAYITAMLLQKAQKSLETLINKGFSNIENVRKMAFYNKITTILLDMRIKSRGG